MMSPLLLVTGIPDQKSSKIDHDRQVSSIFLVFRIDHDQGIIKKCTHRKFKKMFLSV